MENYILLIIRCWTRFSVLRWFSLLAMIILMKGLVDSPIRYGGNIVIRFYQHYFKIKMNSLFLILELKSQVIY